LTEIGAFRKKVLRARRAFVGVGMEALIEENEVVLCADIEVDATRTAIRGAEWLAVTCLRFGQAEPVVLIIEPADLAHLAVV
jgi:hypothetical protein